MCVFLYLYDILYLYDNSIINDINVNDIINDISVNYCNLKLNNSGVSTEWRLLLIAVFSFSPNYLHVCAWK